MTAVCCEQLRVRDAQLRSARKALRAARAALGQMRQDSFNGLPIPHHEICLAVDAVDAELYKKAAAFSTPKNPVKTVKPK